MLEISLMAQNQSDVKPDIFIQHAITEWFVLEGEHLLFNIFLIKLFKLLPLCSAAN